MLGLCLTVAGLAFFAALILSLVRLFLRGDKRKTANNALGVCSGVFVTFMGLFGVLVGSVSGWISVGTLGCGLVLALTCASDLPPVKRWLASRKSDGNTPTIPPGMPSA